MKRIFFFAMPADIVGVLKRFEENAPIKFVEIGDLATPNRAIYLDSASIPNPGIATHETGSLSQGYMVSHKDTQNHLHTFVSRKGERRWSLDNGDNEQTVVLVMAGLWKTGTLLPGNMSTLHDAFQAQQIMKWFSAALKQEWFVKVREWWIGPAAMEMLKSGGRLTTTAEQSPPEFDLRIV